MKPNLYHERATKIYLADYQKKDVYKMNDFILNKRVVPDKLYKYSSFNGHTKEAILNDYIYIAPASKMDDQFELALSLSKESFNDENMNRTRLKYFNRFCTNLSKANLKVKPIFDLMKKTLKDSYSIETVEKYLDNEIKKNENLQPFVDKLDILLNGDEFNQTNKKLLDTLFTISETIGLYSMTECKDSQVMWNMYGKNYKGILIEYDMKTVSNNFIKDLLVVRYADNRETDPLNLYIDIMCSILGMKSEEYIILSSYQWLLNTITTKNHEWAFQKEWRVLSNKETKHESPKISAIYYGKYIESNQKEELLKICKEKNIKVFEQYDDFEKMKVNYKAI